ncbi:MAG TPA: hypothetical protein VGH43_09660 [Jatrophihabitans sp.]
MNVDSIRPWQVKAEHCCSEIDHRLYEFAQRRSGQPLTDEQAATLDAFLARLDREQKVVDYDPNSANGWLLVPRHASDDPDSIIRQPGRKRRSVR